ncbi:MAG: hypothetical protein U1F59_01420 [Candidatus Competibacteraceae bacterium]
MKRWPLHRAAAGRFIIAASATQSSRAGSIPASKDSATTSEIVPWRWWIPFNEWVQQSELAIQRILMNFQFPPRRWVSPSHHQVLSKVEKADLHPRRIDTLP